MLITVNNNNNNNINNNNNDNSVVLVPYAMCLVACELFCINVIVLEMTGI